MRPGSNRVADDLVFVMPAFIHEIGGPGHHMSMRRTCEFNEDSDWIPGTGPSNLRWWLHELLDDYIFYPIKHRLREWTGEGYVYDVLSDILGFFWGINCGFPLRDVVLYTVWCFRGSAPRAVFRKIEGKWIQTYPERVDQE